LKNATDKTHVIIHLQKTKTTKP